MKLAGKEVIQLAFQSFVWVVSQLNLMLTLCSGSASFAAVLTPLTLVLLPQISNGAGKEEEVDAPSRVSWEETKGNKEWKRETRDERETTTGLTFSMLHGVHEPEEHTRWKHDLRN